MLSCGRKIKDCDNFWSKFFSFKESDAWEADKLRRGYIISEDCKKCKSVLKFCYVKEEAEHIRTLFKTEIETPIIVKGTNIRFFTPNGKDFRLQIKMLHEDINLCLPTKGLDGDLLTKGEKEEVSIKIDKKEKWYLVGESTGDIIFPKNGYKGNYLKEIVRGIVERPC